MLDISTVQQKLVKAGLTVKEGCPLSGYTTFRIGGPAALLCEPTEPEQVAEVIRVCRENDVRYFLLGNGSNTLFSDAGFSGVVIHLGKSFSQITIKDTRVNALAGAGLPQLCRAAMENGLSGLEFAYGIPGSVGGAVYMNAGAYGSEVCCVTESVLCLDTQLQPVRIQVGDCDFSYRNSIFQNGEFIILEADFHLTSGARNEIEARMEDYMSRRRAKQPLEYPSAGSTFKRPQGAFAAALIEQCGLKGMRIGGAAVSEKHSGFVINLGGATCADVVALSDEVCRIVQEKTGYVLQREVRVIG